MRWFFKNVGLLDLSFLRSFLTLSDFTQLCTGISGICLNLN